MFTFAEKLKGTQRTKTAIHMKPSRSLSAQSRDVYSIFQLQRTIGNQAVQRLLQSDAEELQPGSATIATKRFDHDFSRLLVVGSSLVQTQPKLTVSTPGDNYKHEADPIANQLMRMPGLLSDSIHPLWNRLVQGLCPACEDKSQQQPSILSQTAKSRASANAGTGSLGPGSALPISTRRFFEPRFGKDFGQVRVHLGRAADTMSRSLKARAFTTGDNIFFRDGEFNPSSRGGQRLIAHELGHVLQQNNMMSARDIVQLYPDEEYREEAGYGRNVGSGIGKHQSRRSFCQGIQFQDAPNLSGHPYTTASYFGELFVMDDPNYGRLQGIRLNTSLNVVTFNFQLTQPLLLKLDLFSTSTPSQPRLIRSSPQLSGINPNFSSMAPIQALDCTVFLPPGTSFRFCYNTFRPSGGSSHGGIMGSYANLPNCVNLVIARGLRRSGNP